MVLMKIVTIAYFYNKINYKIVELYKKALYISYSAIYNVLGEQVRA